MYHTKNMYCLYHICFAYICSTSMYVLSAPSNWSQNFSSNCAIFRIGPCTTHPYTSHCRRDSGVTVMQSLQDLHDDCENENAYDVMYSQPEPRPCVFHNAPTWGTSTNPEEAASSTAHGAVTEGRGASAISLGARGNCGRPEDRNNQSCSIWAMLSKCYSLYTLFT